MLRPSAAIGASLQCVTHIGAPCRIAIKHTLSGRMHDDCHPEFLTPFQTDYLDHRHYQAHPLTHSFLLNYSTTAEIRFRMFRMLSHLMLLLPIIFTLPTSAVSLPPALQLMSRVDLLSNGSHEYVKCLSRPNITYLIYDSPLELDMTFGHRSFLTWQLTTFLQTVLIDIKPNAVHHPNVYLPDGYYYYHEHGHLGTVIVVPSYFKNFTWSDLYLVLHGLAEYIVTAPHAYEMCVEINFREGGLAGVIFIDWWTSDVPTIRNSLRDRDDGSRRLPETDS